MKTNSQLELQSLDDYLSLKYPMSIYPEDDGGYTVIIPDLPGCISQGETLEEAIENINEARELWIETVYYSGKKQISLPSKRISVESQKAIYCR
jgi:antitoxin HicB